MRQLIQFICEDISYHWQCCLHRIQYQQPLRKVIINGAPKSGTTWMRQLLASTPQYHYIGNFKDDLAKFDATHPGDIIHSHHAYTPEFVNALSKNDIRMVYLLRDPRDRCVSHLFHALRSAHHSYHKELLTMNEHDRLLACMGGLPDIIPENWSLDLLNITQQWLDSGFSFCLVRYEDLLANPHQELKRVFAFLDINLSEGLLDAIIKRNRFERKTIRHHYWQAVRKPGQENKTEKLRKGIKGDWQNYFHQSHVQQFKQFGNERLMQWGYEQTPDWGRNQPA